MTDAGSPNKGLVGRARGLLQRRVPVTFMIALVLLTLMPYLLKYLNREKPVLEMPTSSKPLGIKELISDLKSELGQLEDERNQKNEAAAFDIMSFDLEISFMVRASSEQKTGVEYQVVTADSEIQQGMEKIQKLTLHMKPRGERDLPTEAVPFPSGNGSESENPTQKKGTKP